MYKSNKISVLVMLAILIALDAGIFYMLITGAKLDAYDYEKRVMLIEKLSSSEINPPKEEIITLLRRSYNYGNKAYAYLKLQRKVFLLVAVLLLVVIAIQIILLNKKEKRGRLG